MAIIDLVKYNGGPDVFAWKYPSEELSTWTQLIVNESQEAILLKGGKAFDTFTAGRHTLQTANIPLLREFIGIPFGGRSPFTAEVWYINRIDSLDIKWGTPSPVQLQDPKYNVFISIRSYGQFGIRVVDSRKFLTKLVGTLSVFDKTNISNYFKGIYLTKVKDSISTYLIKKAISVLEINAYLDELSEFLKEKLQSYMLEYGIELINFFVNDISVPENDTAVKQLKDALAKKAEMDIVGYNYTQERSFDTLEGAAKNPGGQNGFMGAGIGLGMGVGLGNAFGEQMSGITDALNIKAIVKCEKCGSQMPKNSKFCPNCGNGNTSEEKSEKIKCSNCGFYYDKTVKFCPECGNIYNACPNCGADIPEGEEKCAACGSELSKKCPACGVKVDPQNKFCHNCGEKI